ncbi:unnamed protein product, partial [Brachionus calyciflorus]
MEKERVTGLFSRNNKKLLANKIWVMDSILRSVKYEKWHHSFYSKIEATKQAVVKTTKNFIEQSISQQKEDRIMANNMRAPSVFNLETNVDLWLARFDSYLEINRIFADRDKINI